MSLAPAEQFKGVLEKSKDILILIPQNPSGDAVGSAWALYFFLENKGLVPTVAFANDLDPKYSFLPKPERLLTEISGARDFVLSFKTSHNKIVDLKTEIKEDQYNIYLTPEKGTIDPRDFSFILARFRYDLIIVIDCPDLERLGKIYENNPDLFYEVPIVNIDWHSNNDGFGQINLTDILASSCSEIMRGLLDVVDSSAIDKKVADCLLAGIISATDSFQKKNTTPKALVAAAALMDRGAEQQAIIRWLYKTQPLNLLKLWGRAMAKIKWDEKSQLVWADLTVDDFVQSRTTANDVPRILEKLQENYSDGKIFMAFYNDTPATAVGKLKITDPELLKRVSLFLDGIAQKDILELKFPDGNLAAASDSVAKKIKELGL